MKEENEEYRVFIKIDTSEHEECPNSYTVPIVFKDKDDTPFKRYNALIQQIDEWFETPEVETFYLLMIAGEIPLCLDWGDDPIHIMAITYWFATLQKKLLSIYRSYHPENKDDYPIVLEKYWNGVEYFTPEGIMLH